MRIGTRSILFGYHQFLLHPLFVLLAWLIIYRRWPQLHQLAAIVTHDLGYWGSSDMDGDYGEEHPGRAATWWRRWAGEFGERVAVEIEGHSGFYCKAHGVAESKLMRADKLAISLYPMWLALFLYTVSGELQEYRQRSLEGRYGLTAQPDTLRWLMEMRAVTAIKGLNSGELR